MDGSREASDRSIVWTAWSADDAYLLQEVFPKYNELEFLLITFQTTDISSHYYSISSLLYIIALKTDSGKNLKNLGVTVLDGS